MLRRLLGAAGGFVDDHAPAAARGPDALREGAQAVAATLEALHVAERAVEQPATEAKLRDRVRSATDRAVLRVLREHDGEYLRRGEVWEEMDSATRPTAARVGQILVALHEQRLVLRMFDRAQGGEEVSFFALSATGRELCERLGVGPEEQAVPLIARAVPRFLRPVAEALGEDEAPARPLPRLASRGGG